MNDILFYIVLKHDYSFKCFCLFFFKDNLLKRNNSNAYKTVDDKFYALANKYNDLLEQNKQKENQSKDLQKNLTSITKQRDQLQHDYSKALLARDKLESLCRELQRHNKAIKVNIM